MSTRGVVEAYDPSNGPVNFYGPNATKQAEDDRGTADYKNMGDGGVLSTEMRAHNPLVTGSPDIAWKSNLNLSLNKEKGTLSVIGSFSGKGFPSFEGFIEDEAGNKAFLGVLSPENKQQILKLTYNTTGAEHTDVGGFSFNVDKKGNFTGVNVMIGKDTKTLSLDQWNSVFEGKKASGDAETKK